MKLTWINNLPVWADEHGPFPSKVIVCPTCGGTGAVLIDGMRGHAYTPDELGELGEDFIGDMTSGVYDRPCEECRGKRVSAELIEDELSERDQERLDAYYEDLNHEWEIRREIEDERRFCHGIL